MNEKINEIDFIIKELKKEKKEIQNNCPHKQTHTKFFDDTNDLRIFCKECTKMLGYPSKEQIYEFLNIKIKMVTCNNCNCDDGKCLKEQCNCDNCNCKINETSSLED
jgi:hypothetical protein